VDIDVRTQDQVKIVTLRGKLNLGPALDRANATIKDLLDAGEARFLLNPSKVVMQTLKLVRVLSLFEVFEDQQAAIASFQ